MADEKQTPVTEETKLLSRRQFSKWLVGGITAFIATAAGIPIVGTLVSAAAGKQETATTVRLGKLEDYPIDQPKVAQFSITQTDGWERTIESRSVWVVRSGNGESVSVFNGHCTHLGCAFNWDNKAEHFICPCHNGVFGKDGTVQSGPPPRTLDTLTAQIVDGHVEITYEDFRSGIPEKKSV